MTSVETIWQDFLKIVREEVGSRVVETWFKAVRLARWDALEKTVYLQAPNQFVRQWLSTYYIDLLRHHLERLLNERDVVIVFLDQVPEITASTSAGYKKPESVAPNPGQSGPLFQPARVAGEQPVVPTKSAEPPAMPHVQAPRGLAMVKKESNPRGILNEHYRFDTFVVGPSNTLAFSAAQAAAEHVGTLYNPLFIYGGSGLGKTHLLHAYGNHVREHNRRLSIVYQSADRFIQDFIMGIRTNKVYEFEARYKDVDVLLMDDIQFISKKEQTQEAFFRIFNMLHQSGKQIVFSSDSMPCDIVGLAERMRSRLEGGLIADIHLPSLETKMAILHKKAEANNQVLDDDVAYFIASRECSSIRELEGMLIRVVAYASLTKQPMSAGLAKKVLHDASDHKKDAVGPLGIAKFVGKYFNYTLKDIRSSKRNKDLALARHVAMYLMKRLTNSSLREIGTILERRDHTTVMHAVEKIEAQMRKDRVFAQELKKIEQNFLSGAE